MYLFNNPKKGNNDSINLLKSNERYYHKELKLVNNPPVIERNINLGTIVSRVEEYYLEPVASYTLQDLTRYFYNNMPFNIQEWPINKLVGMLKYKVNQYGIDKLLFMIDFASQDNKANDTNFNLGSWDEYINIVNKHLEEMKYTISDKQEYYVPKKRYLFND